MSGCAVVGVYSCTVLVNERKVLQQLRCHSSQKELSLLRMKKDYFTVTSIIPLNLFKPIQLCLHLLKYFFSQFSYTFIFESLCWICVARRRRNYRFQRKVAGLSKLTTALILVRL